MNKFSITLAALTLCGGIALAQEKLDVVSISPEQGIISEIGSAMLHYPEIPVPNPDCSEPAVLYHNSRKISEIYTSNSTKLQRFGEGQDDNSVIIKFLNKPVKETGEYEVVIPEGYFTFSDDTKVNAAYTAKYSVPDPKGAVFWPAAGYYDEIPNIITLTIPGVVEIIDNHQPTHPKDNTGNMAYFTPDPTIRIGDDVVIEGNTLTWKFADEPFKNGGTYRMYVFAGALTLVYEDGRRVNNPEYLVVYHKLIIPFPTLDIVENSTDNEVYELGDFELSYPEDITFGIFMANPSLFKITESGDRGDRLMSWNIDRTNPIRGSHSVKFLSPLTSPFTEPGEYFLVVGKSSFSAVGPFEDPLLFPDRSSEDYDPADDPYAGVQPGDPFELWNGIEYVYRIRIVPSPAELTSDGTITTSSISTFPIYFPNAKEISFPDTPAEESLSIRDRFWREQKGYELTLDIVNSTSGDQSIAEAALTSQTELNKGCMAICHIDPPLTSEKAAEFDIYIPKGTFVCDGMDSRQFTQHVAIDPTLTGISTPEVAQSEGEPAVVTVVTPAGVTILKDAPASELFNIPAGLYIINGRPTMLR